MPVVQESLFFKVRWGAKERNFVPALKSASVKQHEDFLAILSLFLFIYPVSLTKTPAQHLARDALSEDLPCSVTCRYGIVVHALCSGLHFQTSATITWKCWPYCLKQIARKNFSYIFKECLRLVLKVQQRLKLAYVVCKTALPHSGEKIVEGILHCLVLRQKK